MGERHGDSRGGGGGKRDGGVEWIASLLVCRYDMLYKWKDYA